ncbi:spike base protein, RCAP_Rcc01079 family [Agrobacterium rosae]|uniref:AraC family transcriptional regulator n=1 Tax=Agrobacterium rosae TaxID=1972867 RepID=A0A1R3TTJ9_9HYPH|nr:hypothetical protein [Agrobacterium rosae]SCX27144.1 hypothetical protein DSM25559_2952 [Agrobacterium rosae]
MPKSESRARTSLDAGYRHWQIVPNDTQDLPDAARCIFCQVAGTIMIRDEAGIDLPYTLTAGQLLPFHPVRVLATGTTGTFYAWT